ncbi:MAG TPA: hypothetical protein VJW20_07280 [Candidatus Angelobacter sp.]|nr:hypothetical protein [Candidatus Angelobacter sp.]
MTLLQRIDDLLATWRIVLPHLPPPAPEDAVRWLHYSDTAVEQAILRTGKKFAAHKIDAQFDPSRAHQYATATARIMATKEETNNMNTKTEQKIDVTAAMAADVEKAYPSDHFAEKARKYVDEGLNLNGEQLKQFVNAL